MDVACVGISHHTAPLEIRERLWFSDDEVRAALPSLKGSGLLECVLFSTCNRTELYVTGENLERRAPALKNLLIEAKGATGVGDEHLFSYIGNHSIEHLFRVASGIDSMIVGDLQILAQVKEGFHLSTSIPTTGLLTNRLFQSAFHVGKRARAETHISDGAVSVSYAAVELAGRIFDRLAEKSALVIGAGEMAELTAKHLQAKGIGRLILTNRTTERAEQLASTLGVTAVPFGDFRQLLGSIDIIISSIESDRYILTKAEIEAASRQRHRAALFLIDIGVPRNIDPHARTLENVFLYDIDNLKGLVDENLQKRHAEIAKVEQIIQEELEGFQQWRASLEATPTIAALIELTKQIRQQEIEKHINRFQNRDRELLNLLTKRIVNKILHTPIVNLKNGSHTLTQRLHEIALVRRLFGIDKESGGTEP